LTRVLSENRFRFSERALAARGVSAERLATLRSPAGLDIGAITPEEIALSILAEIVAVRRAPQRKGSAHEG
jgi:xanthine dehydrogenase accessory factor